MIFSAIRGRRECAVFSFAMIKRDLPGFRAIG